MKKIFQNFVFVFIIVLMVGLIPSMSVLADEEESETSAPTGKVSIDYSGKLDDSTGEPAVEGTESIGGTYFILKKNELAYDAKKDQYHILCGTKGFYSNVPEGAILSQGETLQFASEEGVTCKIYQNGELLEATMPVELSESGEYLVLMQDQTGGKERTVSFVILGEQVNNLVEFRLPEGFVYTGISLDGEEKNLNYDNYFDFLEDGFYLLQWENRTIGKAYTTEFILDTTVPELDLPEVFNGAATKQVSFYDMEEGEYVRWIKDSRSEGRIEDPSVVLSEVGSYIIRVYDQAGNYTEYTFVIEGYFDQNAVLAILLAILLLGSGFYYCRRLRKYMRVG